VLDDKVFAENYIYCVPANIVAVNIVAVNALYPPAFYALGLYRRRRFIITRRKIWCGGVARMDSCEGGKKPSREHVEDVQGRIGCSCSTYSSIGVCVLKCFLIISLTARLGKTRAEDKGILKETNEPNPNLPTRFFPLTRFGEHTT